MKSNFPKRIHVELSLTCNLACSMCPRKFIPEKEGYMNDNLWKKVVDECSKYEDVTLMLFWRGESLLHPNFNQYVEYAMNKGVKIEITTNGILINKNNIESLLKMKFISISAHNLKSIENAKRLLLQRKGEYPIIQISLVEGENETKLFIDDIVNSDDLGGFDRIRYFKQHTKDGVFGSGESKVDIERKFCAKLNDLFVIGFNGCVSRCSYIWKCEKEINVKDSSIYEIWNGDTFNNIYNNYPDLMCSSCNQWNGATNGELYQIDKKSGEKIKVTY